MTPNRGGDRVLVTGATGFVGRHLCAELVAAGRPTRALTRGAPLPADLGVESTRVAGLHDREGIRRALDGCGAVIHLAARVHVMREQEADPAAAFHRANVDGTRVLLEEAVGAGVTAFLFASTVKTMGEASLRPWTESDLPQPLEPYGASKLAAEQIIRELADEAGIHAPILRLPLVYGAGVRANMLRLFSLVDRGVPLPFGGIRNRRSILYVGNLTAALRHLLDRGSTGSEVYFTSDGRDPSTPELIQAIAAALGRRPRLLPCPERLLRLAAGGGDVLSRWLTVPLTSRALDRLLGSLQVDDSRLRGTGFTPPFSLEQGLEATAAWYRATR